MNLTWQTELGAVWVISETVDLGVVYTDGYSRMQLYMTVTDYSDVGGSAPNEENRAYVQCDLTRVWQFGEDRTSAHAKVQYWWVSSPSRQGVVSYPSSKGMEVVDSPYLKLTVNGRSWTEFDINVPSTISCLVSIGIYLRNE